MIQSFLVHTVAIQVDPLLCSAYLQLETPLHCSLLFKWIALEKVASLESLAKPIMNILGGICKISHLDAHWREGECTQHFAKENVGLVHLGLLGIIPQAFTYRARAFGILQEIWCNILIAPQDKGPPRHSTNLGIHQACETSLGPSKQMFGAIRFNFPY